MLFRSEIVVGDLWDVLLFLGRWYIFAVGGLYVGLVGLLKRLNWFLNGDVGSGIGFRCSLGILLNCLVGPTPFFVG